MRFFKKKFNEAAASKEEYPPTAASDSAQIWRTANGQFFEADGPAVEAADSAKAWKPKP
jgi:hypothetical protein